MQRIRNLCHRHTILNLLWSTKTSTMIIIKIKKEQNKTKQKSQPFLCSSSCQSLFFFHILKVHFYFQSTILQQIPDFPELSMHSPSKNVCSISGSLLIAPKCKQHNMARSKHLKLKDSYFPWNVPFFIPKGTMKYETKRLQWEINKELNTNNDKP